MHNDVYLAKPVLQYIRTHNPDVLHAIYPSGRSVMVLAIEE
jgi:hypothetical protein